MKKPKLEDFKRKIYDNQDYMDCYMDYYRALEEYIEELEQANAQFITVAPELLEALQELVLQVKTYSKGYSDTTEYFKSEIKQAEKVINKALGL